MKEELRNVETRALTMHYYAYLNDQDVVEQIVSLPSVISDPKYIEIATNDQSLIGKKYNRVTGKFEDIMFYYAILDDKDIVTQVVALAAKVTDPKKIEIIKYDQSLVGKWYNRNNGTFSAPPIHVLAKANTGQINTLRADGSAEDKWLHTELMELKNKITEVERGNFGGYKTRFKIENNQEITEEWTNNGKRLTFTFDTGIPGYFPKMIRLAQTYLGRDSLVADFYIVKNPDGSIKLAYSDQDYIGVSEDSNSSTPERIVKHGISLDRTDLFVTGFDGRRNITFNEGGYYFVSNIKRNEDCRVEIGNFSYNENSISFVVFPSSNLRGHYTNMKFNGYVY